MGAWRYVKQVNQFFRIEEEREGKEPRIVGILHNELDVKRIVAAVNAVPWAPPRPKTANGFTVGDKVRLKQPKGHDYLMTVEDADLVVADEHKVKCSWNDVMNGQKVSEAFVPAALRKVPVSPPNQRVA